MTSFSQAELLDLAGGPVLDVQTARDLAEVTPDDCREADKIAAEAQAIADETTRKAVAGKADPAQAGEHQQRATFARMTAALKRRERERYLQAERLRALDE